MRKVINNLNIDIVKEHPDYTARVVSDEGKIGRGHLDRVMELETLVPDGCDHVTNVLGGWLSYSAGRSPMRSPHP